MSTTTTLLNRNRQFASDFTAADLPILAVQTASSSFSPARSDRELS